jgi:hypothetical protein
MTNIIEREKSTNGFFTNRLTVFKLLFKIGSEVRSSQSETEVVFDRVVCKGSDKETRGQFHQHFGAKRKCAGSHSSALVGAVQFHQQNYAQLHDYPQLENTFNFYAVCPMLCASNIGVYLLVQKLCLKCW